MAQIDTQTLCTVVEDSKENEYSQFDSYHHPMSSQPSEPSEYKQEGDYDARFSPDSSSGSIIHPRRYYSPFQYSSHEVRNPCRPVYGSRYSRQSSYFIESDEQNATSPFPAYDHATSSSATTPEPISDIDQEEDYDKSEEEEEAPSDSPGSPMSAPPPTAFRDTLDDLWVERGRAPTRQLDYFLHHWEEPEIWSSWRYIRKEKAQYPQIATRLKNASWRTWAKSKYELKTTTPETLNW